MKIFISQPMNGKSEDEIRKERKEISEAFENPNVEILDTIFDLETDNPIYYLGKSIEVLAEADLVVFASGWENARGCKIEFEVAKAYNKPIFIF